MPIGFSRRSESVVSGYSHCVAQCALYISVYLNVFWLRRQRKEIKGVFYNNQTTTHKGNMQDCRHPISFPIKSTAAYYSSFNMSNVDRIASTCLTFPELIHISTFHVCPLAQISCIPRQIYYNFNLPLVARCTALAAKQLSDARDNLISKMTIPIYKANIILGSR